MNFLYESKNDRYSVKSKFKILIVIIDYKKRELKKLP